LKKNSQNVKNDDVEEEDGKQDEVEEEEEEEDDDDVDEIEDDKGEVVKDIILRKKEESDLEDPTEFCCPITKSIMEVPVIAADGHTYEKDSILQWLKNHSKSPLTGEKMEHKKLVPNVRLRQEIQEWLKKRETQPPQFPKITKNESKSPRNESKSPRNESKSPRIIKK